VCAPVCVVCQSAKFGVSRREMDEYAATSHQRAAKAHKDGIYKDEIVPFNGSYVENGIKVGIMASIFYEILDSLIELLDDSGDFHR
jgi:hypothetical protein